MNSRRSFLGAAAAAPMAIGEYAKYSPGSSYPIGALSGNAPQVDPNWQREQIAGLRQALTEVDSVPDETLRLSRMQTFGDYPDIHALKSVSAVGKRAMIDRRMLVEDRERMRANLQCNLNRALGIPDGLGYGTIMRWL